MAATLVRYSGDSDEAHPEIFTVMPPQPKEKKPGQLPESVVKQFFEEGYAIVENFFKKEELDACRVAIEGLVDDLAQQLYKAGKIKNLYKEESLFSRLTKIEEEFPGANVILHKTGRLPQAFRDLWSNERLLNAVEQLIGPEIAGHPVWNLRTKTPQNEATTVPWHQDCGYLDNDSYKVLQPTAWIPFLDANEKNGCMEVVAKGHRPGKIAKHTGCYGNTWYVMLDGAEIEKTLGSNLKTDIKLCEVPYGGMLLINNMIPHRSLSNVSNEIRWSIDLRWQDPSKPYGFYGLKDGILMRTTKDPNHKIDWEPFDTVDRAKAAKAENEQVDEDEFDTTIQGPWMKKWELVHQNRHTDKLFKTAGMTLHKA
ncbi:uncharacterized protein LOC121370336 [Gigantopelta aegis]|uniref:uncharacterized protein LOC121370336 n=1 Tax=Gigantopelta aegis TaxID=1735272 RepID=UPI001B88E0A2|nr:uncharacterized protein LOC121370336 [Gigantopelta aegis]